MITVGGDLRVGRIGYGAMRLTGPNLWGDYADRDGSGRCQSKEVRESREVQAFG
jgi:hypothetical protein